MFEKLRNLLGKLFGKDPDADAERYQVPQGLSAKARRQVRKIIEKARGDDVVPRTAQQSIPFQRIFPDGICRVSDKYYTKTIQFQNINYQLAQQEDKTAIFEEWCGFLNFFDSSIHFELSFMNMSTDAFERSTRIQLCKDKFNPIRNEYSQMLRSQLDRGNNGLTKTKYITFGIEAESMKQAKPRLEHVQMDLLNNFRRLGASAQVLNGRERLQVMKLLTKLRGRIATALLAVMMGTAVMPATAFAQVKGDVNAEAATTEATTEESTEEKIGDDLEEVYGKTDDDLDSTEPMDPLTPDGNLTLVDDLGEANGTGKQFITVVTKSGNYFYIIIDRDDEGEGTVHFLNQVDEADIFNLLDEDAQEEYIASVEAATETEEETVEAEPVVEEPEEPEVEEDNSGKLKGIFGIVGILAIVGAGIGYYFVGQSKKKKAAVKPDPDEDYTDDESDELIEFAEDTLSGEDIESEQEV